MINRETSIFLVVGVITVLVDFLIYSSLLWIELLAHGPAKAVGFISGTVFSYFANRFWTFGYTKHGWASIWRFGLLYALTLFGNVMANSTILSLLTGVPHGIKIAFVFATFLSAALNFLGMKFFVFRTARK